MSLVGFIHRHNKPLTPTAGAFYWIDAEGNDTQIWFAPTSSQEDMILLNDNEVGREQIVELAEKIDALEDGLDEKISEIYDVILDDEYVIAASLNDLNARLKQIEKEGMGFTDSDYDTIADKVNERISTTLTWKAI